MRLDVSRELAKGARATAADATSRLRRGVDVSGRSLPRKEGDGPPGVATPERGGIFPLLSSPSITTRRDGFRLDYHPIVESFNNGTPGPGGGPSKDPRRVVGIDAKRRAQIVGAVKRSVVRQINASLRAGR